MEIPPRKGYFPKNAALIKDNLRMTMLYEVKPPEKDAVALMYEARADRDRYEETLKKWLHLHSYRHTPEDIFALANETHAALHPTQAPTTPEEPE